MKSGLLIVAFVIVLWGCIASKGADLTTPQVSGVPSAAGSYSGTNDSATTNNSRNAENEKVIRPGDTLLIIFTNLPSGSIPELAQPVKGDGTVTLIYNKAFQVVGRKTSDLEKEIWDYYVPAYFTNLTIMVRISSESFAYVSGEFRSSGRYSWTNGMTLKDAIQAAGGFTEYANRRIRLRHLDGTVERYRLVGDWVRTNNPALKPWDSVVNPREI
jgi:protein involved in polysaccharide export with SLBB domain